MAYREFHDASGVRWEVWEAHPTLTERRRLADRRALLRPSPSRRTVVHSPFDYVLPPVFMHRTRTVRAQCFRCLMSATFAVGIVPNCQAQTDVRPAQTAVEGRVTDGKTGLALAEVSIVAAREEITLASGLSDSAGAFRLVVPGQGSFLIHLRRLGYQPTVLRSEALRLYEPVSIAMSAVPTMLDTVSVVGAGWRSPRLQGFEDRARLKAGGSYITRENIEAWHLRRTSDAMRHVLGARLWDSSGTILVVSSRGEKVDLRKGVMMGNCVMRVGVDGHIKEWGFAVDMVDPNAIHGIEVYNGPASIPSEFGGMRTDSFCGLVMIWTQSGH